jgi:hypothetical protein
MAKAIIRNLSSAAQRVEFLSTEGEHSATTVFSKKEITIDSECIITTREELTKRGLKLIEAPVAVVANVSSKSGNTNKSSESVPAPAPTV